MDCWVPGDVKESDLSSSLLRGSVGPLVGVSLGEVLRSLVGGELRDWLGANDGCAEGESEGETLLLGGDVG